jgi:type IV pilus assembly protein PilO
VAKGVSVLQRMTRPMKIGAGVAAISLIAAAYFLIFHSEVVTELDAAKAKNEQLMKELGDARLAEQAYQKDLAELAERDQRQRELGKILPTTTEYPAFLSAVQSAANLSGVSLGAWTPKQEIPGQFYARVPMKVELSGRFHQIARFFYNVGQLDRVINMENISITDPKVVGDDIVLQTEALATAFHAMQGEAPKPDDGRKSRKDRQQ